MSIFDKSMYEFFLENSAEIKGSNKTIVFYGKHITKDKFIAEIDKVAEFLQEKNIKKGDNVLLCLGNIPDSIICFYAINKIGAIVNVAHPLMASDTLQKIAQDMDSSALIVFDEFMSKYPWLSEQEKTVIVCSASDYLPVVAKQAYPLMVRNATKSNKYVGNIVRYKNIVKSRYSTSRDINASSFSQIKGEDIAVYMHSGGTTGQPKIVEMSNIAFNNLVDNMRAHIGGKNLSDKDGMLMVLPIFHTFGLGVCMHTAICVGAECILMPKFEGKKACHLIKRRNCTMISGVPNMYSKIVFSGKFCGKKIAKLRSCYCGGDKLAAEVYDGFAAAMKKVGSNLNISEGYGLTESCICAINKLDKFKFGSIGLPAKGNKFAIVDDNLNFLKANVVGEIALSSSTMMSGYYGDKSATDKAFFYDKDNAKWLKTGDLGYIDEDGFVFFVERKKRLIKISGINVFPQEIENTVKSLEEVAHCCAVKRLENGKTYIKLFVQPKTDSIDKNSLKEKIYTVITQKLLKYCIPKEIEFVSKLPLTQIGKVNYRALEQDSCEK